MELHRVPKPYVGPWLLWPGAQVGITVLLWAPHTKKELPAGSGVEGTLSVPSASGSKTGDLQEARTSVLTRRSPSVHSL
jgi:hypothetical protein